MALTKSFKDLVQNRVARDPDFAAALLREESRGGHFRLDFPERDDAKFLANIVLRKDGGKVRGELRPVPGLEAAEPPPGALAVAAAA